MKPLIIVVVLAIAILGYALFRDTRDGYSISNFKECIDAGNPVLESYPEQCMANGQTFVNQ